MKLIKYIKVKVGEYQKNGETKGRYMTVGRVLLGDDGREMVLLDRTFNPAGVPSDRESIILNFWDADKEKPLDKQVDDAYAKAEAALNNDDIPF